ncbi:MAG: hypothetical protein AB1637_03575 [Elusimicrobiota bacterium]
MSVLSALEISALIFFMVWGFFISSQDLKTCKVSNKKIVLGLYVFLILISAQILNTVLGNMGRTEIYLDKIYFYYLALNSALAVMGGMVLWYGEIWPAGDAKFYMISVSIMPLALPEAAGFPKYLWISVMINTFVAAGIYAVARFFYESYKMKISGDNDAFKEIRDFREKIKSFFSENSGKTAAKKIIHIFFSLGVIFLAKQVANMYLMAAIGRSFSKAYIIYFLLFFGWEKAGKIFEKKSWKMIMIILYVSYFVLGSLFFRQEMLAHLYKALSNVLKFSVILTLGRFVLEYLVEKKNSYWVSSSEVKEGMVLSSSSIKSLRSDKEISVFFDDYYKDGIDKEQAEKLSYWLLKIDGGKGKIEMVKGYPFALWIYVGCLFILIFNKSILSFFKL